MASTQKVLPLRLAVFCWAIVATAASPPLFNEWQVLYPKPAEVFNGAFAASVTLAVANQSSLSGDTESLVLVFGGISGLNQITTRLPMIGPHAVFSQSLWVFHIRFLTWTQREVLLDASITLPAARAGHSMDLVVPETVGNASLNMIFLFGGVNSSQAFADTWLFYFFGVHVISSYELNIPGPSARWGHRTCVFNHSIYLFGGFSFTSEHSSPDTDVWRLFAPSQDAAAARWERYIALQASPSPRGLFYIFPREPDSFLIAFGWTDASSDDRPLDSTLQVWLHHDNRSFSWAYLPITLGPGVFPMAAGASTTIAAMHDMPLVVWGSQYSSRLTLEYSRFVVPSTASFYLDLLNNTWQACPTQTFASDSLTGLVGMTFAQVDGALLLLSGLNSFESMVSTKFFSSSLALDTTHSESAFIFICLWMSACGVAWRPIFLLGCRWVRALSVFSCPPASAAAASVAPLFSFHRPRSPLYGNWCLCR
jgi:hypothetical protein